MNFQDWPVFAGYGGGLKAQVVVASIARALRNWWCALVHRYGPDPGGGDQGGEVVMVGATDGVGTKLKVGGRPLLALALRETARISMCVCAMTLFLISTPGLDF